MSNTNNARFVELEYSLQKYFDGKISKVMTSVKNDLSNKQADELRAHQSSLAGIFSMANYDKAGDTSMAVLKYTGEWNSKTAEDYVAMCQQKLHGDKGFQEDLLRLATEWRNAVVAKIGRAKYDQLSQQLGGDLAYAYVATRMDDLMMHKLVKDNMPKSTADYIIRKAAQGSIWGLEKELTKSPLAQEIEAKGEKAFNPSKGAKVAGKVGSSVIDAASFGIGKWKAFATYVGGDLLINGIFKTKPASEQKEQVVETAISKSVFGSDTNVFTGFRQQTKNLAGKDNVYLTTLNTKLHNKIAVPYKPLMDFNIFDTSKSAWQPKPITGLTPQAADRKQEKYKNVPLMVAPGQEDAYLEEKAKAEAAEAKRKSDEKAKTEATAAKKDAEESKPQNEKQANSTPSVSTQSNETTTNATPSTTASNGWDQLVQASGMGGFSNVIGNAGYVVSMLPDILVGLFTGKTQSLNLKSSMMPLAAILLGMFVRNPFLKFALIAMGGLNLFNKAGKETLEWQNQAAKSANGQAQNAPQYRQYADEPLNPRITNPVLQGTTLIANIDRVPCNIQLTQNVVAAYQAGALPLNTLANAVLNKYDANQQTASRQYGQVAEQTLQQTETIHRTR